LRKPKDIINEVKRNISLGIKNITLLGQNVNDYKFSLEKNQVSFVDLLRMVEETKGLENLDFITAGPRNTSKELFTFIASSSKILTGFPVLGIVLYNKRAEKYFRDKGDYLNIMKYIKYGEKNQTPHTSLIPQFISLNKNLDNNDLSTWCL